MCQFQLGYGTSFGEVSFGILGITANDAGTPGFHLGIVTNTRSLYTSNPVKNSNDYYYFLI